MQNTFADRTLKFFNDLKLNTKLPSGVSLMNPYAEDPAVMEMVELFYAKYCSDNQSRLAMLGINPGRFGGGVTGIAFTDPVHLEERCGIPNALSKKHELSSLFIYDLIRAYGGEKKFYSNFYLGSICPLGFVRDGKNLNFYDDKKLQDAVEPFIIETLYQQIEIGLRTDLCFCLGEGKNFKYFSRLNERHSFFDQIIPLSHPRFIMQYRRKRKEEFVNYYLKALMSES